MVPFTPIGNRIDKGRHLLRRLDEEGVDVRSALWVFNSEHRGWTLRLAAWNTGLEDFAGRIFQILDEDPERSPSLDELSLFAPADPLVSDDNGLPDRAVYAVNMFEKQLGSGMVGAEFFEDAYIYQVAA